MRSWRVWIGLAISAVLLTFAFRGQDFGEIRASIRQVDYRYLIPALALYFTGVWVRAIRWRVLLRPVVNLSTRQTFPVVVIGYTANNVLPLRTGEVVRSYLISRTYGVRKTATLATIAVERIFDGLTLLSFMLVAMSVVSFTNELRHVALIASLLFAVLLCGLFLLTLGGTWRDRVLQLLLGPLPRPFAARIERLTESFLTGLGVLKRRRDLAMVMGTSILAWSLEAGMYWTIARGFGGDLAQTLGAAETLLTTGVANLATLVPSSPGYVGPFETAIVLVVGGSLGVASAVALSYAIVVHVALWLPITVVGAIEWWRQQMRFNRQKCLGDAIKEAEPSATPGDSAISTNGTRSARPVTALREPVGD